MSEALPPLYIELAHAVGISNPTEQTLLTVMEAVAVLDEAAWAALSPPAQAYFNEVAEQVNNQIEPARILWPNAPAPAPVQEALPGAPLPAAKKKRGKPQTAAKASAAAQAPSPEPAAHPTAPAPSAPLAEAPSAAAPKKPRRKPAGGPGNRASGRIATCRRLCIEHPDLSPDQIFEELKKQFPGQPMPARASIMTLVCGVRATLRDLAALGKLK